MSRVEFFNNPGRELFRICKEHSSDVPPELEGECVVCAYISVRTQQPKTANDVKKAATEAIHTTVAKLMRAEQRTVDADHIDAKLVEHIKARRVEMSQVEGARPKHRCTHMVDPREKYCEDCWADFVAPYVRAEQPQIHFCDKHESYRTMGEIFEGHPCIGCVFEKMAEQPQCSESCDNPVAEKFCAEHWTLMHDMLIEKGAEQQEETEIEWPQPKTEGPYEAKTGKVVKSPPFDLDSKPERPHGGHVANCLCHDSDECEWNYAEKESNCYKNHPYVDPRCRPSLLRDELMKEEARLGGLEHNFHRNYRYREEAVYEARTEVERLKERLRRERDGD